MKKIKSMFFTALVIGVLCAGTVSARQLRSDTKGSATCGGSCGVKNPCHTTCCYFPGGATPASFVVQNPVSGVVKEQTQLAGASASGNYKNAPALSAFAAARQ